jgi:predicted unusual protein kinase regulating ubiquinone biosynthesis (AarF/ABC1/UbiB family)
MNKIVVPHYKQTRMQTQMQMQTILNGTMKSSKKLMKIIQFTATFQYLNKIKKVSSKELGRYTRDNLGTMGATFIKIGQLLSSRTDLIEKEFANELSALQDSLPPFDISDYRDKINELFDEFNEQPIASASIGQVHIAKIKQSKLKKDENKKDIVVAIKLKRPGIEEEIKTDFQMLLGFIAILRRFSDKRELYELETVFKQYNTLLYEEINFEKEIQNMTAFKEMFSDEESSQWIKIPNNYPELSCNDIIVMEYLPSIKINDLDSINEMNFNKRKIANKLIESYLIQIIEHGKVHIDPHPGNVGITKNGKLVFYDYGMITNINKVLIDKFQDILMAVTEKDCEKIANLMVEADIVTIEPENMIYLKSFVLSFLNYLDTVDISYFRENFIDKLSDSQLPFLVNSNFLLLLRGLTILEGVCKSLDPNFNYTEVITKYMDTYPFDIRYFENKAIKDFNELQQLRVPNMIDKSKKNEIENELLEKRLQDLTKTKTQIQNKQSYFNYLVVFLMCIFGFEGDIIQHNALMQIGITAITFLSLYSK